MRLALFLLVAMAATAQTVVQEIRKFTSAGDLEGARKYLATAKGTSNWNADLILAHSWMGRGAQASKKWEEAERLSSETRSLCLELLKTRKIDDEKNLPLALGASIEVRGHTLANTGRLSEAVDFLKGELKRWHASSMRARIQKNLHLLSLEGKRAPKLETSLFLGDKKIKSLKDLRGKPVMMFLWAHWCSDCKEQGPILETLRKEYPNLQWVAPTQRYGYAAKGEDATPEKETPYIAEVQKERYGWMSDLPIPVSEENFRLYGVSTTPTLVLLDGKGVVRLYRPGKMTAEELRKVFNQYAK